MFLNLWLTQVNAAVLKVCIWYIGRPIPLLNLDYDISEISHSFITLLYMVRQTARASLINRVSYLVKKCPLISWSLLLPSCDTISAYFLLILTCSWCCPCKSHISSIISIYVTQSMLGRFTGEIHIRPARTAALDPGRTPGKQGLKGYDNKSIVNSWHKRSIMSTQGLKWIVRADSSCTNGPKRIFGISCSKSQLSRMVLTFVFFFHVRTWLLACYTAGGRGGGMGDAVMGPVPSPWLARRHTR